ncbi:DUF5803 family protein [Natrinema halophilum]|uniref:Uncharacterized protein n=1 Tax=Natrinema halophilum TaxID=1699371 RepID=A0A7D5GQ33_9EURY|nr:DUF5803 family protein [Natrinema halophilum]QLG51033.1 DUF5803 family protein [Natrinema halophilum]
MNRRLVYAVIAVALLTMGAGCAAIFNGVSDEQLDREQNYSDLRGSDADVRIDIEDGNLIRSGEFRAVYNLSATNELSLYRSTIYREEPLQIHSVRYWYPNGTELTGSELDIEQGRSATTVEVPDENGTLAFSGEAGRKTIRLPTYVSGSYQVTIPDKHRTTNFLFGDVTPGGYEREIVGGQERLTWDEIEADRTISLRYYLVRDIPLFLGLIGVAVLFGGIGIGYYYRQVKQLQEQREKYGVDVNDDSDSGPPPGLR